MTQPFTQGYHLPGQPPPSTDKIYMSPAVREAVKRLRQIPDPDPDLQTVLALFWEELKPIPFGFVAIDTSGSKWVYMGITGDRHSFVQEGTRKNYRANQTSTLVTKFPNLKEFAV